MDFFIKSARQNSDYKRLSDYLSKNPPLPALVTGVSHIHKAHFIAALVSDETGFPALVITESEGEAQKLVTDINSMTGEETALLYPARELLLGNIEAASREYEYKRIFALSAAVSGKCKAIVATAEAAAQLTLPAEELKKRTVNLAEGDEIEQEELVRRLVASGYSRADLIEGAGQFSVRGGIVDVFPPSSQKPFRIELWGDTVDSISEFDPDTQRRSDSFAEASISPASETLFDSPDVLAERIEELAKKLRGKRAEEVRSRLLDEAERIRGGLSQSVSDRFFPLCYEKEATAFDYTGRVFICENTSVRESFRAASIRHAEDMKLLTDEGRICKGLERYMLSKSELSDLLTRRATVYFDAFVRGGGLELGTIISVQAAVQTPPWSGEYGLLEDELKVFRERSFCCLVLAGTEKGAKNLADDLRNDGFSAIYTQDPKYNPDGYILVAKGTLSAGMEYQEQKIAVFTHTAVHAERRKPQKKKRGEEIRSLSDISVGDLVVHSSHGIGVFEGVRQIASDGVLKDYIRIKYAGADVLYVPVTQLDMISRYIGTADTSTVKLNKLNSEQWRRSKTRAKAAAKEMAAEFIKLYAERMNSVGYAFPPDDDFQEDFEQHFPYIETDSQIRCIDEIKADMMKPRPMERLLCGDVGFGKTEVALRAAFKCVEAGKQCALLVPTTVLAWQHFQTASARMEGFPINIELMTRYRTAAEQRAILEKLKKGKIDLLIGTHRIIQNDIKFKDLGLVIIDEEQRFGVAHKDKFKELFRGVDILTLSATPIPRTLNMAMSGIRDMSVLDEPPQDRRPISTYVMEHDWGVIAGAIQKELRRNGQVYYVHNRIDSIFTTAAKLQELLPDALIGVAHGKMSEEEILEVWRKLLGGEIDILVCTTIIETGVDVPNVNTLIIEQADKMGLAQLHQLRGRVGRTNKRAYAYFTFEPGKVLTEVSQRRLDAIREFTQFGSGFRIALADLEIRGAGSILGASQSGHLANVGYDMYLQLLEEAVREERGEEISPREDCLVDVRIDAFIPEKYISNQSQRVDCYRKIARVQTEEDKLDILDELIDRYGEPPKSVVGLVEIARLRSMARASSVTEITQNDSEMVFFLSKLDMGQIAAVNSAVGKRARLETVGKLRLVVSTQKGEAPLELMKLIIGAMDTPRKDEKQ